MKHYYVFPLFTKSFSSLEDAKWNIKIAFTRREALKYLHNEEIHHYVGDRLHSITSVLVDEFGNISFGKTRRV